MIKIRDNFGPAPEDWADDSTSLAVPSSNDWVDDGPPSTISLAPGNSQPTGSMVTSTRTVQPLSDGVSTLQPLTEATVSSFPRSGRSYADVLRGG